MNKHPDVLRTEHPITQSDDTKVVIPAQDSDVSPKRTGGMTLSEIFARISAGTGTDDQTASEVPISPITGITSVNVQGALQEMKLLLDAVTGNAAIRPPEQDLAALKALNTTDAGTYPDKVIIWIEDLGLYAFDRENVLTGDDNLIVAPTTGPGRWIKVNQTTGGGGTDDQTAAEVPFTPGSGLSSTNVQAVILEVKALIDALITNDRIHAPQPDLAAIKALNTTAVATFPDRSILFVETLGLYALDRESVAAGDDNLIIEPTTGPGRWIKINNSGGGGGTDDQTATEVPFTPASGIVATDVQAMGVELKGLIDGIIGGGAFPGFTSLAVDYAADWTIIDQRWNNQGGTFVPHRTAVKDYIEITSINRATNDIQMRIPEGFYFSGGTALSQGNLSTPELLNLTFTNNDALLLDLTNEAAPVWEITTSSRLANIKSKPTHVYFGTNTNGFFIPTGIANKFFLDAYDRFLETSPIGIEVDTVLIGSGQTHTTLTSFLNAYEAGTVKRQTKVRFDPGKYLDEAGQAGRGINLIKGVDLIGTPGNPLLTELKGEEAPTVPEQTLYSTIDRPASCTVQGFYITSRNSKYPIHCDDAADPELDFKMKDLILFNHGQTDTGLVDFDIGGGQYFDQKVEADNVRCLGAGMFFHNSNNTRRANEKQVTRILNGCQMDRLRISEHCSPFPWDVFIQGSSIGVIELVPDRAAFDANQGNPLFDVGYLHTSLRLCSGGGNNIGKIVYEGDSGDVYPRKIWLRDIHHWVINASGNPMTAGQACQWVVSPGGIPSGYPGVPNKRWVKPYDGTGVFAGILQEDIPAGEGAIMQFTGMPEASITGAFVAGDFMVLRTDGTLEVGAEADAIGVVTINQVLGNGLADVELFR